MFVLDVVEYGTPCGDSRQARWTDERPVEGILSGKASAAHEKFERFHKHPWLLLKTSAAAARSLGVACCSLG